MPENMLVALLHINDNLAVYKILGSINILKIFLLYFEILKIYIFFFNILKIFLCVFLYPMYC